MKRLVSALYDVMTYPMLVRSDGAADHRRKRDARLHRTRNPVVGVAADTETVSTPVSP